MKPKKKHQECDVTVKIVIVGDSGVGKTNILCRYCEDDFKPNYTSTIGVDFKIKIIQIDNVKIKLQIWDTAGQQRFKNVNPTYFKGALVVILAYSIDSAQSFTNVQDWIKRINQHSSSSTQIFLVGSKCDLVQTRKVSVESGKKLADQYGYPFYEVSAKDGTRINQLFDHIGKVAFQKINKLSQPQQQQQPKILLKQQNLPNKQQRKSCGC